MDYYRRSIQIAPNNNGDVYVNLGYVLQSQHKPAEAEKAFAEALRANPRNAQAQEALNRIQKALRGAP